MKLWAVTLSLWMSVISVNFDYPSVSPVKNSNPVHVVSKEAHIDLTTKKIVHILGEVTERSMIAALAEEAATENLPGDRLVLIKSPGGDVMAGQKLIDGLTLEHNHGIRIVCVAMDMAHSMAFNTLSFCDIRLATKGTTMVVHKVAIGGLDVRGTARNLRKVADELDKVDEPYAVQNSKMMRLERKIYDLYADLETEWTANILYSIGYLNGFAEIK